MKLFNLGAALTVAAVAGNLVSAPVATAETKAATPDRSYLVEQTKSMVTLDCFLLTGISAADGVYTYSKGKYDFRYTLDVSAPTHAVAGEPFEYTINASAMTMPNPIPAAVPVEIKGGSQGRIFFDNPKNAEVVSVTGKDEQMTVTNLGDKVRLGGETDTDKLTSQNDAVAGGAKAGPAGSTYRLKHPSVTWTLKSDKVGEKVAPGITRMDTNAMTSANFLESTQKSFLSLLAEATTSALGDVKALARCNPTGKVELPETQIVASASDLPALDPTAAYSLTLGELPLHVLPGQSVPVTVTARNRAGELLKNKEILLHSGRNAVKVTTNDLGVAEFSVTEKEYYELYAEADKAETKHVSIEVDQDGDLSTTVTSIDTPSINVDAPLPTPKLTLMDRMPKSLLPELLELTNGFMVDGVFNLKAGSSDKDGNFDIKSKGAIAGAILIVVGLLGLASGVAAVLPHIQAWLPRLQALVDRFKK